MNTTDFLIIGAGIVGLTIAREVQQRYPDASVTILEKESRIGEHASGRNSGVLHSGIYYTADSLKARFTRDGNIAWQAYCEERGLALDRCGKLVLATSEHDFLGLDILEARAKANQVYVKRLDEYETHQIERRARTLGRALFVPSTATIDPTEVNASISADFLKTGGVLWPSCEYKKRHNENVIEAENKKINAGFIINCAGLYADRIAQDFGFGQNYTLLPFKGLYLYAESKEVAPRTHIYPVPDLRNPFLGVHFTRTVDGRVKIGPTAIPVLWREHYNGVSGFNAHEFVEIVWEMSRLFIHNNNGFRKLSWQEIRKQSKHNLIADSSRLMTEVNEMKFRHWGRPGIRAQLMNKTTKTLVMDFIIEGDDKSLHVLNAVSPAFTCALPFAKYVVDNFIEAKIN